MTDTPSTVAYLRVSTAQQDVGIQRSEVERYLRLNSSLPPFSGYYQDPAVSGSKKLADRPDGGKMLQHLRSKDHLIVVRLDRLGRNMVDCIMCVDELCRRGVVLHVIDAGGMTLNMDTPMGKAMVALLSVLAEMEREMIRARTVDSIEARRRAGMHTNRYPPYGKKFIMVGGRRQVTEDPVEMSIIREIFRRHDQGTTIEDIWRWLDRTQPWVGLSRPWSRYRVSEVLKQRREGAWGTMAGPERTP